MKNATIVNIDLISQAIWDIIWQFRWNAIDATPVIQRTISAAVDLPCDFIFPTKAVLRISVIERTDMICLPMGTAHHSWPLLRSGEAS